MKANIDLSEWLKNDLEEVSREVENWPLWMKQVFAVSERPLELSQEAMCLKNLAKPEGQATESLAKSSL
ncbi:hypothetical protein KBI23_16405 [bacterium]|nr:hypothetical protein [bacterium]MBP9806817.1 hypothetical protein [bacterium]